MLQRSPYEKKVIGYSRKSGKGSGGKIETNGLHGVSTGVWAAWEAIRNQEPAAAGQGGTAGPVNGGFPSMERQAVEPGRGVAGAAPAGAAHTSAMDRLRRQRDQCAWSGKPEEERAQADVDRVEWEVSQLRRRQNLIDSQIQREPNEEKVRRLEKETAQIQTELE